MQCQRLLKQVKAWYVHVSNETMAPARMVAFMEEHAAECDICLDDPDLQEEMEKITEMILPESKIPKAVRMQREQEEMEKRAAEEETHGEETQGEKTHGEETHGVETHEEETHGEETHGVETHTEVDDTSS